MPINDAYRPKVNEWVCTCPAFAVSRFLVCKHLIQRMHPAPPIFFLEAERCREPPFWKHKTLKPLEEYHSTTVENDDSELTRDKGDAENNLDERASEDEEEEEEDDDEEEEVAYHHDGRTFEEALTEDINLIADFTAGLKYQAQFRDQRLLNALEREGAGFLRLAKACMEKERRMNSTRSRNVATWEKSTSSAMFYRARPTGDRST